MTNIERPDRDYYGYEDAMEWEVWDDAGRDLLEEDEEDLDEEELDEIVGLYLEDDYDLIEEKYLF